ncbi:MAG: nitroreductase [Lachnospiraceae bacterium]|nr:nitroreductase [Lachnospiraceae bacterium]
MELLEIMKARHSVRKYLDKKIEEDVRRELSALAEECNRESGLSIQILYDEPECYAGGILHYGFLKGVKNYIALVGKDEDGLDIKSGYYGEKLVLKAQELGLNTCWTYLTYSKGKCAAKVGADERLACTIALGYGADAGKPHKNKPLNKVCDCAENMPEWFAEGMEAVMLAPTAVNQQKFYFSLTGGEVTLKSGKGTCVGLDTGIVQYHFEAVTGHKVKIIG